MKLVLLCLWSLVCTASFAADSLSVVRSIPLKARLLSVDEIGNAYVVKTDNNLLRYNENGDSTGFFRSIANGDIGAIDARNPLNILVYYPGYSKLQLLDRMMTPKSDLDLRTINIFNATVVAGSADGNIWIYDPFNAVLKKFNENGEEVSSGNDLRQQLDAVPNACFMTEQERKLFLCDSSQGIYVFDQYATYINKLPFTGVKYLQAYKTQIVYRRGYEMVSYNLPDAVEKTLQIPERQGSIINAALVRDKLYVLYSNELVIYRLR